jgi:hypothetical protein
LLHRPWRDFPATALRHRLARRLPYDWAEVSMRAAALSILWVSFLVLAGATARAADDLPGEKAFSQCRKLPEGKRVLKLNIKPDSELTDLIGWMSTITCSRFVSDEKDVRGKKVTVKSTGLITAEEAYRLFTDALATVGLTIQPAAGAAGQPAVLRIVKKAAR